MEESRRPYHRKAYKKVWRDVKQRNAMNPRMENKRQARTYLTWGRRNTGMKIDQADRKIAKEETREARGQPWRPARKGHYIRKRAQYQRHMGNSTEAGVNLNRWIDQDERIDRWLDE